MSTTVKELRHLQSEILRTQTELGIIANEISNHPDKPQPLPGVKVEASVTTKWRMTRALLDAKKVPLQLRLLELQNRRDVLSLSLKQEPLSLVSLGRIIDELTNIEAKFTVNSAEDAWCALTALIDNLEYDEKRVRVEQQVKKLETAA